MPTPALQGRTRARTIDDLQQLLRYGEVESAGLASLSAVTAAGLWRRDGEQLVATAALVRLVDGLPQANEAVPAVLACEPALRQLWLGVIQGRLREMGERRDLGALCTAISTAGQLAGELTDIPPALAATGEADLEQMILPTAAHEAPAFPVLLRALAATNGLPATTAAPLPAPVWNDPGTTWVPGRLLQLPAQRDGGSATSVLAGGLDDGPLIDAENEARDAMHWVLHRPWAFLLAQMVFTQEAWEAERIAGRISFELEPAHVSVFQHPPQVEVVVTQADGAEVRCGTLGEYVQRLLAQLDVTVLAHHLTATDLDGYLGDVIAALLAREIWRFEPGSGAQRPSYQIHPHFSNACYRALGSRAFYRLGSHITAAIRRSAESWAAERLARSGTAGDGA